MKKQHILILLGFVTLVGCSPQFYSANTQNVPMLEEKGDVKLSINGNGAQGEMQAAYAISSLVGLQFNGGVFFPSDLDNGNGGSGRFFELGLGIYKPLGDNFIFETYGLAGTGYFENHLPSTSADAPGTKGDISSGLLRYGIQPSLGYKKDWFYGALSSRITNLSYMNTKGDLVFEGRNEVTYLKNNKSQFLVEPALTLGVSFGKVSAQLQYCYSLSGTDADFPMGSTMLTAGLKLNL